MILELCGPAGAACFRTARRESGDKRWSHLQETPAAKLASFFDATVYRGGLFVAIDGPGGPTLFAASAEPGPGTFEAIQTPPMPKGAVKVALTVAGPDDRMLLLGELLNNEEAQLISNGEPPRLLVYGSRDGSSWSVCLAPSPPQQLGSDLAYRSLKLITTPAHLLVVLTGVETGPVVTRFPFETPVPTPNSKI